MKKILVEYEVSEELLDIVSQDWLLNQSWELTKNVFRLVRPNILRIKYAMVMIQRFKLWFPFGELNRYSISSFYNIII